MKTIIAGSRSIDDPQYLINAVNQIDWEITEVVSGTAEGVDQMGEEFAEENDIPVKKFPADWDRHGKSAGAIRNQEMAEYAQAAVILWDGESNGTSIMIQKAAEEDLETFICEVPDQNQETLEGVAEQAEWCK